MQDQFHLAGSRFDRYDHAWLHLEGAAVDFLPIDLDVAVGDELLCSEDRRGQPEAVDDIVKAALERSEEELRSVAFRKQGFLISVDQLLVAEHAVNGFELLPLIELDAVVGFFLPLGSMLAGRVLLVEERVARLAEDVGGKSARDAVLRASVTSHSILREKFGLKHNSVAKERFFEQG